MKKQVKKTQPKKLSPLKEGEEIVFPCGSKATLSYCGPAIAGITFRNHDEILFYHNTIPFIIETLKRIKPRGLR